MQGRRARRYARGSRPRATVLRAQVGAASSADQGAVGRGGRALGLEGARRDGGGAGRRSRAGGGGRALRGAEVTGQASDADRVLAGVAARVGLLVVALVRRGGRGRLLDDLSIKPWPPSQNLLFCKLFQ